MVSHLVIEMRYSGLNYLLAQTINLGRGKTHFALGLFFYGQIDFFFEIVIAHTPAKISFFQLSKTKLQKLQRRKILAVAGTSSSLYFAFFTY